MIKGSLVSLIPSLGSSGGPLFGPLKQNFIFLDPVVRARFNYRYYNLLLQE